MADDVSSTPGRHAWRGSMKSGSTNGRPAKPSRRMRLVVLAGCGLTLAGLLVGLVGLLRPAQPAFLFSLPIAEYRDTALPVNSFALRDSKTLLAVFPNSREPLDNQQGNRLVKELERLRERPEKTIIVYLSALAVVRGDSVYLLPVDADPEHLESGIPIPDVLRDLKSCPASHKLLILDLMRPFADADLGILTNDVAAAVQAAVARVEDSSLHVLCPCSPGEGALPAEELQQSLFGYYLSRGLAGPANGAGPRGKRDQYITLTELGSYVRDEVSRWARQNRGARQTPVLFGSDKDFNLVLAGEPPAPPTNEDMDAGPTYPAWLADAWKRRDAWRQQQAFRVAPQVFARLESDLCRAEERWQAGVDPEQVKKGLAETLAAREDELNTAKGEMEPAIAPKPFALALATEPAAEADPDVIKDFAALADALPAASAAPAGEKKVDDGAKKDAGPAASADKFLAKYKAKPPLRLAWSIVDALASDRDLTLAKLQLASDLLQKVTRPLGRPYAEILLVRRLAKLPPKGWSPAVPHEVLAGLRDEGRILAKDPRAIAEASAALEAAASARRAALKALLDPDEATPATDGAEAGQVALDRYAQAASRVELLDRAYRLSDEAHAFLPGYVRSLLALRSADDGPDRRWHDAVAATAKIDALLAQPASGGAGSERLQQLGRLVPELDDCLSDLQQPFAKPPLASLAKAEGPERLPAYLQLTQQLAGSRFSAGDRVLAWQTARKLGQQLWQQLQDEESGKRTAGTGSADAGLTSPWDTFRVRRRAATAIGLLKLAGAPESDNLEQALNADAARSAKSWQTLGQQLKEARSRQRGEQAKHGQERRVAHRRARLALWQWLGKHYAAEQEALPDNDEERSYFKRAAAEYLREP